MKTTIAFCIALLASLLFTAENTFPRWTSDDLEGNKVCIDSILAQGNPIVLTFWATWCKPCKKELVQLHQYWTSWIDSKGKRPYSIVAICEDGPRSMKQALAMAKSEGWDKFIMPYDKDGSIKKKAGVADIPELFILRPDGTIFYRHIGFNPGDEKETIAKLEELIKQLGKTIPVGK